MKSIESMAVIQERKDAAGDSRWCATFSIQPRPWSVFLIPWSLAAKLDNQELFLPWPVKQVGCDRTLAANLYVRTDVIPWWWRVVRAAIVVHNEYVQIKFQILKFAYHMGFLKRRTDELRWRDLWPLYLIF